MNVCRQTDGHQPHTRHSLKKALELIHQPRQTDRQTIQTRSTGSQRAARNGWLSASVGQMRSSGCHANIRCTSSPHTHTLTERERCFQASCRQLSLPPAHREEVHAVGVFVQRNAGRLLGHTDRFATVGAHSHTLGSRGMP
mmetsp:Transcript_22149/g.63155  ORF Transcript_22149/g.63155 Transcript_22149/m.63155 type:complete len:141 (-) Transcript_22149:728-1150(-)